MVPTKQQIKEYKMTTAIFSVQGSTAKEPMIYQTINNHLIGFEDGRLSFRRLPEGVTEFTKAFSELELVDILYHLKLKANRYNKSMYDNSIEELTILCEEIHAAKNSGERVLASSEAKSICKPLPLVEEGFTYTPVSEGEKQLAQAAAYNKKVFKEAAEAFIKALNSNDKKND